MPQPFGLALDAETHDLFLHPDNSLAVARDGAAIAQHVKQRMKMFQGEWFLDTTAGLPWIPQRGRFGIFDRPYRAGQSEALIKAEILDTPGVVEITEFEARIDASRRALVIEAEIVTIFDRDQDGDGVDFAVPSGTETQRLSFSLGFNFGFAA